MKGYIVSLALIREHFDIVHAGNNANYQKLKLHLLAIKLMYKTLVHVINIRRTQNSLLLACDIIGAIVEGLTVTYPFIVILCQINYSNEL